ncbi:MAG: hypothetical protein KG028_09635, partial [Actinobacteria bacterium]|nr:hypothetical protein [Actinomycetota bacterium]
DALQRVDAAGRTEAGTPAVRFLLRDGREFGTLAMAYLDENGADQFAADLRAALEGRGVEISLTAGSFRRAAG